MSLTVGFILLTHKHPHQIQRLVNRLNQMFDFPTIVCHHDFSRCALVPETFPKNVSFVQPHVQTKWGEYSIVEAMLCALAQLHQAPPDWTIFLSGADYPIKSAAQILADLEASQADFHMKADLIQPPFESDRHREMYARYFTQWIPMPPLIAKPLKLNWNKLRLKPMFLMKPFVPYHSSLKCYAGEQWFCGNARSIHSILNYHHNYPRLASHLKRVMFPEETYFQTIVANERTLTIDSNDWRYVDWSRGGSHPKILDRTDLPKLLRSSAHFARKFEPDATVLDDLDRLLNLK